MLNITTATASQLPIINKLANQIWWHTYSNFISVQQISFMLNDMYIITSLQNQFENKHIFKLAKYKNKYCGFASYSKFDEGGVYTIQKLYLHQNVHGLGFGKIFLTEIENELAVLGATQIQLNVNRENKAYYFYLKMGYQILKLVDIPYYNFTLNDFVMFKQLISI